MRPGVARKYLEDVIKRFEEYAARVYPPALTAHDADEATLLGAVRYVLTRRLDGHEPALCEILTKHFTSEDGREIHASCVDAMIATTDDRLATAHTLSLVAAAAGAGHTYVACRHGLEQLGNVANEALLAELSQPHNAEQLRNLAALLARVSKVSSPKPLSFWGHAGEEERAEMIELWHARLLAADRLDALPTPAAP